jgi:hypothetical protein
MLQGARTKKNGCEALKEKKMKGGFNRVQSALMIHCGAVRRGEEA